MCLWRIKIESSPGAFTPTGEIFYDGYGADIAQMPPEQQEAAVNAVIAHMDSVREADETHRCCVADYIPPGE
jgi:hypothetical protein